MKNHAAKGRQPTRAIIRNLPADIGRGELLQRLRPLPAYNHYYVARRRHYATQRPMTVAYINFDAPEGLRTFLAGMHGADVAPNQRVIRVRKYSWRDPQANTIESDPAYKQFVNALSQRRADTELGEMPEDNRQQDAQDHHSYNQQLTPLLKFIREKKKLAITANPADALVQKRHNKHHHHHHQRHHRQNNSMVFVNSNAKNKKKNGNKHQHSQQRQKKDIGAMQ